MLRTSDEGDAKYLVVRPLERGEATMCRAGAVRYPQVVVREGICDGRGEVVYLRVRVRSAAPPPTAKGRDRCGRRRLRPANRPPYLRLREQSRHG